MEASFKAMAAGFETVAVSDRAEATMQRSKVKTVNLSNIQSETDNSLRVLEVDPLSGAAHISVSDSDAKSIHTRAGSYFPVEYYELALVKTMRVGRRSIQTTPGAAAQSHFTLNLRDSVSGKPVSGATAKIILPNVTFEISAVSDQNGTVVFPLRGKTLLNPGLMVEAGFDNHWGYFGGFPSLDSGDSINIDIIDIQNQPDALRIMGTESYSGLGDGVKIAVIDTGVGPHRDLPNTSGDNDSTLGHGTHVAGIIAGNGPGKLRGLAPNSKILSYRVFEDPSSQIVANFRIHQAIYQAVEDGCHLINMSLKIRDGLYEPVVARAIEYAKSKGVVCFAAAGNDFKKPVAFPGKHPDCLAISACGNVDGLPATAIDRWTVPKGDRSNMDPSVFLAKFSNIGKLGTSVDYIAPGAGIIATVPGNNYAPMSGTSMACPAAVGAAAQILSQHTDILSLPSDHSRHFQIVNLIQSMSSSIGFSVNYEGNGMIGYNH